MGHAKGELTFGQSAFIVVAGLSVEGVIAFPEAVIGGEEPAPPAELSAAYDGSIESFVEAVDVKYQGAVAPDDAAIIAYSVCHAFDADATTAYSTLAAQATASGADPKRFDFMARTAVQKVCPRHRSELP